MLAPRESFGCTQRDTPKPELDLLYDGASILSPIITIVALIIAWNQLNASQRASKGATYIGLFESLTREFANIEALSFDLVNEYYLYSQINSGMNHSVGEYIKREINKWTHDNERYKRLHAFLLVLENLGLLARQGYVSLDDIYFLLEGPINNLRTTYGNYLQTERDGSQDGRLLEHSCWLILVISDYKPRRPLLRVTGHLN